MLLLTTWACVIFGSLFFKKSRIYSALIIIFGILLFTFSSDNADSLNYYISYTNLQSGREAVLSGNVFSNILFYIAGLFNEFKVSRFLFSSISFLLIYKGAKRYTENVNIILGLFLIAPYVIDATQVKSMVSMAVWFYFSYYLFEAYRGNNRRKNIIIYLIGVLIATEFHFSYALTAFYVLVVYFDKKKMAITAIIVNAIGLTTFGLTRINAVMDVISSIIPRFQNVFLRLRGVSILTTDYNYEYRVRTTLIFYAILLVAYILLIPINKSLNTNKDDSDIGISYDMAQFVFRLNIASLVFFPLMAISMELYRVQRDLLLIDYTYLTVLLFTSNKTQRFGVIQLRSSNIRVIIIGLLASCYYLYIEAIYGNINSVFLPLFHMTR